MAVLAGIAAVFFFHSILCKPSKRWSLERLEN
jgi:hypothetical protein